ncbi:Uncharacterised protein [Burkholderia pseudomallei]|nr:Uncharacterised protein [Burkholderia pseudomallei]CAJ8799705.1 Uncharacterised protein [Burkholderia pseudomallei]CAJ9292315.1 Uncharacterised protein [Burkholderia pseudomallei]
MHQKFLITIGHHTIAFDSAETAMRAYALLTESTPVRTVHVYGNEFKRPESLENIQYVRNADDIEIELKRVDASKFALHFTEEEFREKCRIQPTEVEGEARLVEAEMLPAQIEGPGDTAPADETEFF